MQLPMAVLADFPLAIGLAMEMAAKMASPKELDRLRELGRAELSAMGITAIEEERLHVDVVLDAIPEPEDAKRLVALGLKRVRKDVGGRRFAGAASPLQVSALVARLGGLVAVLDEADRAVGSGADGNSASRRRAIRRSRKPRSRFPKSRRSRSSPKAVPASCRRTRRRPKTRPRRARRSPCRCCASHRAFPFRLARASPTNGGIRSPRPATSGMSGARPSALAPGAT